MTDDELTELECAILDACAEKRREGWMIAPGSTYNPKTKFCCPLGALAGDRLHWDRLLIPEFDSSDFVRGFDGHSVRHTAEHDMGRRFRERLERNEL